MKWHYDKKNKEWYITESPAYANNGFSIKKESIFFYLTDDNRKYRLPFKKLYSAKKVAELINEG